MIPSNWLRFFLGICFSAKQCFPFLISLKSHVQLLTTTVKCLSGGSSSVSLSKVWDQLLHFRRLSVSFQHLLTPPQPIFHMDQEALETIQRMTKCEFIIYTNWHVYRQVWDLVCPGYKKLTCLRMEKLFVCPTTRSKQCQYVWLSACPSLQHFSPVQLYLSCSDIAEYVGGCLH